ncbi:M48 family metalloprotease [Phenylobacterium soli]|uniref:Peptidase M48 domain-containing protein n=1 Tax=Phenylobacterium soli TaxID=2170551 RepID=A0A328AEL0_9CAUL|nr:M48 family metalloprotease [Phenylobacterium soli]RAK53303.1 hypothetical protein DJ017_01545 [Phenylobacterium soli]
MGPRLVSAPISPHGRIAANRRETTWLLAAFAVLLVPILAFLTSYLGFWLALYVAPVGWISAQVLAVVILAGLLIGRVVHVRRALPQVLGAVPLDGADAAPVRLRLANLALGVGLPAPDLMILDDPSANAFACGPDAERAVLVVTRGLLERLDARELDGVFAHELAHIRNGDVRLNSTLAAILSTARLPPPIYWVLMVALVLGLTSGLPLAIEAYGDLIAAARSSLGLAALLGIGLVMLGFPLAMLWPALGAFLQAGVARRREFLADAEAATLTRDPQGLALALLRIGSGLPAPTAPALKRRGGAIAHLCIAPVRTGLLGALLRTHPDPARRIAALQAMAPPEETAPPQPAPYAEMAREAVAARAGEGRAAPRAGRPLLVGLLVGVVVQTVLFDLGLLRLALEPAAASAGAAALLFSVPFGFAGAAAALAAQRSAGRPYWWPAALMFFFGRWAPLTLVLGAPDLQARSLGALVTVYLAALTEPVLGAILGAAARGGVLQVLAVLFRAAARPPREL